VRAVLARSYERIHRPNLIGMGVLPIQFPDGEDMESLGLTGEESFDVDGIEEAMGDGGGAREVRVTARPDDGDEVSFTARVRLDTPNEVSYFRNGGILQRVLRDLR
jgi:aconitate hydratase